MDIDGRENSVYEVHTESEPPGLQNPLGNAFFTKSTLLARESEAQRIADPLRALYWKVVNPSAENAVGEPVGCKLAPHDNVLPFAHPEASVLERAAFTTKPLWVMPHEPSEMHAAGDYPNQNAGGAGLSEWTRRDSAACWAGSSTSRRARLTRRRSSASTQGSTSRGSRRSAAKTGEDAGELTPFGPGSYEIAMFAAGGCMSAVDAVMTVEARGVLGLSTRKVTANGVGLRQSTGAS